MLNITNINQQIKDEISKAKDKQKAVDILAHFSKVNAFGLSAELECLAVLKDLNAGA